MKQYKNKISLSKNGRGIYSLDTIMGCNSGLKNNPKGCFNDCYAARTAKRYGYDFSKNVLRFFESDKHRLSIEKKINNMEFDFLRIGNTGDPSEDWQHTINIIKQLNINKPIVIITKHWHKLSLSQLNELSNLDICINTSVSAIDENLNENIKQYEVLKKYCKSILRVVTFDFNTNNKKGFIYNEIQDNIIKNNDILETIFRCSPKNKLVTDGIINIHETKFLGKKCNVSKRIKKIYFGNCNSCLEKCGINIKQNNHEKPL